MDIVGPLPSSKGHSYLLTIIDRFSRWLEAIPLKDCTTSTIVDAFLYNWLARFGVPVSITTDRGSVFESHLFRCVLQAIGSTRIRTTAYHPSGNGLIERQHRRIKEAIKASPDPNQWFDRLPIILLAMRSSLREDSGCSPAQLVYGQGIKLPIDLLIRSSDPPSNLSAYAAKFQQYMQDIGPMPTRFNTRKSRVDPRLATCKYVFVRNDARRGLKPVYNGPFAVVERKPKYFKIQYSNRTDNVTVDRLKAAYVDEDLNFKAPGRVYLPIPAAAPGRIPAAIQAPIPAATSAPIPAETTAPNSALEEEKNHPATSAQISPAVRVTIPVQRSVNNPVPKKPVTLMPSKVKTTNLQSSRIPLRNASNSTGALPTSEHSNDGTLCPSSSGIRPVASDAAGTVRTRSGRVTRPPVRFKPYCTY